MSTTTALRGIIVKAIFTVLIALGLATASLESASATTIPTASQQVVAASSATAAAAAARTQERAVYVAPGAHGVVAVHTGSWGYKEIVFGRATTRDIANSSVWDISALILSLAGPYGFAGALDAVLVKARAQDAVNTGQCFAQVRGWSTGWIYFPGKTGQDCR